MKAQLLQVVVWTETTVGCIHTYKKQKNIVNCFIKRYRVVNERQLIDYCIRCILELEKAQTVLFDMIWYKVHFGFIFMLEQLMHFLKLFPILFNFTFEPTVIFQITHKFFWSSYYSTKTKFPSCDTFLWGNKI